MNTSTQLMYSRPMIPDVKYSPVSMSSFNEYLGRKGCARKREHHCTGCCAHCKKDATEGGRVLEAAAVRRLRCHAEQGRTDMALLISLGTHNGDVVWPSVVGHTLKDAPVLHLPFHDIYKAHPQEATTSARVLFQQCRSAARGSILERMNHTAPNPHFPANTLLLHSVGNWVGCRDELLDNLRALQNNGADVSERDAHGCVAAHYAAGRGFDEDILSILCGNERQVVNVQDASGRTPLHAACEEGRCDAALALLSFGSDPSVSNKCGLTPLHKAVEVSSFAAEIEQMEPLLERLCTSRAVAAQSDKGWTPLHTAAYVLSPRAVRILLARGAPLHAHTTAPQGYTALRLVSLHYAKAFSRRSGTQDAFRQVVNILEEADED